MSVDDPLASLPPPLTGLPLRLALDDRLHDRPAFIDQLLYEGMVLLLCADAGAGKSTLMTQLMAQASIGVPVFGLFACVRPLRVYYLMSERDEYEPLDRLRRMEASVPFNLNHVIVDAKCVGLNLMRAAHRIAILNRVVAAFPDVVLIDPIYGFFEGNLSGEDMALMMGRFTTGLLKALNQPAAVIWGHHNVKNTKQPDGVGGWVEKANPFYGSQFLKAHVTGYYDITQDKMGTLWRRKKNTYGLLADDFRLSFDVDTKLSHGETGQDGKVPDKRHQFRLFLDAKQRAGGVFTAQEAMTAVHITDRYLRELVADPEFAERIRTLRVPNKVTVYTFSD